MGKLTESIKKASKGRVVWENIKTIGIALILALAIKTSIVEVYAIPSGSMENTLFAGDYLIGNKFIYGMKLPIPFVDMRLPAIENPKPGDVIIFKYPLNPKVNYIKRCIAVEGQVVEIRNKQLFVDGELVPLPDEGKHVVEGIIPFRQPAQWGLGIRDNMPPIRVPEGKLFMMGDNRDNSADSRFWGFLDRDLVSAKALVVLWSWSYDEEVGPPPGSLSNFNLWLYNLQNFPHLVRNMRWSRLGMIIN